jgi:hypothetical protein
VVLKKDPGQVAFDMVRISPDSRSVGWLALYPNGGTSYPIPRKLIIYSNARARIFTGTGLSIFKWQFRESGRQIAFRQETVHGGLNIHYELRDVTSERLLAKYDPPYDRDNRLLPARNVPSWVVELDTK